MSIKYNYRKEKDMEKEIEYNERKGSRTGFTMIHKDFLGNWLRVIGPE